MGKGVYRKLVVVEILKNTSQYKKGEVREMHPVLARRLIAGDIAKSSNKKVK